MCSRKYNIRVINHIKVDGHIGYNLKIQINDSSPFIISKRYSELKLLNDLLRKETSSNSFPKFPPKKFFGFNSEEFVKKRQQELDVYFQAICNSVEFSKLNSFTKFIDDCIQGQKENKIISERPTEVPGVPIVSKKKIKSTIDSYRSIFKPNKNDYENLSPKDKAMEDEELKKIVNDFKQKFIDIDFQVKQFVSEKREQKYDEIIKTGKPLDNEDENEMYNLEMIIILI